MAKSPRAARLRILVLALIATVVMVAAGVIVIRATGNPFGGECVDSYSCAEFLTGGECLQQGDGSYCSRYCDVDAECPNGWTCGEAYPTVLGMETSALDSICVIAGALPAR